MPFTSMILPRTLSIGHAWLSKRVGRSKNSFKAKNDLSEEIRAKAVELLNAMKGPNFIALRELFDGINEDVEDYVDDIAERTVQLG